MKIGIGIDTGGTYTDAVVYDFDTQKVLSTAKALTTKDDLSVGILQALDGLNSEEIKQASVISLSTTLATNACVEDRGGVAKLIFMGGDPGVINQNGKKYGLPPANDMYIQESFTKFSGEIERDVDWEFFNSNIKNDFENLDGVGIIEINAMRNSAVVEKKAKEMFAEIHDIPVVCSHELFNELNCLQRGASALLNARLVPVIRDFLYAINQAMLARNINASVVIVRSDGGLMSEKFAHKRPVETLLCGPAASVLGSSFLTDAPNNIVVDMGGTTTDIAIIKNGVPVTVTDGVKIGKWKTFVNGLYIKTFGLGGDTAIHYNDKGIFLEDYRVIPLCVVADKYPQVVENLQKLRSETYRHSKFLHEHYILTKDIANNSRYTSSEKAFCVSLANGPLIFSDACSAIGEDIYTFDISRLIKDGVVQICGLTPTDIMHLKGDFVKFPTTASLLGAEFVAAYLDISIDELCDRVYDIVKRRLYANIVKAMLENKDSYYLKHGENPEIERFINDSYDTATGLSMSFTTDFVLTGVGAPIHIFLDDVAKKLSTKAITPKHCEVANALGAIVGKIHATSTVEIRPGYDPSGITGYTVYGINETKEFLEREDAENFAISEVKAAAYATAVDQGACGEITVTYELIANDVDTRDGDLYFGTKAVAYAIGAAW